MAKSSLSRQLKRLGVPGIGLIMLVLTFFLEYTYSNKHGDLVGSIVYALPFAGLLGASFLLLVTGRTHRAHTHLPWHRQQSVLGGLLCFSLSLIALIPLVNSLLQNGLPDAVGLPIAGVGLLVVLVVLVRLAMINRSKAGPEYKE